MCRPLLTVFADVKIFRPAKVSDAFTARLDKMCYSLVTSIMIINNNFWDVSHAFVTPP